MGDDANMNLAAVLLDDTIREAVKSACLELIDAEVADKRGLGGLAIKAGYRAVKGIRPGFLPEVVEALLPPFASALEPLYDEANAAKVPLARHFDGARDRVADALLAITDARAEKSPRGLVKSTYGKLRPAAKQNVAAAAPRLGELLARFAPNVDNIAQR